MLLGRKSEELINPGYIFAPYIPADNSVEYSGKKTMRKSKINKIFELQLDIKCESPISIVSRYSKKVLNNKYYQTIEIKKSS
jgi:hypothetical protein